MDDDRYTRITLRIPRDLHQRLAEGADATSKSLNAEIVARLETSFRMPTAIDAFVESQQATTALIRHLLERLGETDLVEILRATEPSASKPEEPGLGLRKPGVEIRETPADLTPNLDRRRKKAR